MTILLWLILFTVTILSVCVIQQHFRIVDLLKEREILSNIAARYFKIFGAGTVTTGCGFVNYTMYIAFIARVETLTLLAIN